MVLNNALVRSIANIPRAFVVSGWAYSSSDIRFAQDTFYRPMLNVILTIEYALFGPTPWGWHLTNVLLHSVVTLLVFLVLSELTGRKWLALIAATLFAVHPVHAESVAWVSGVTDPMMSIFALGAFYCYVRYRRSPNIYRIAGSWALFLGALLCKETALALPVMIAYCELGLFNESSRVKERIVSAAKTVAPFVIVYAVYFLLRYVALGTPTMGGEALNPPEYVIRTIPLLIVKYLKLLVVPFGYSFQHYTSLTDSMSTLALVVPILILIAAVAAVLFTKSRLLGFAAAWFAIWLGPTLAVLLQYEPESLGQDRYLYLPSAGFCLAVALGIEWIGRRKEMGTRGAGVVAAVTAAIVIVWSVVLVKQNRVWHDNLSVYQNCVAVEPSSPAARSALGLAYAEVGRFREADEQLHAALDLDPQYLGAYLSSSYRADRLGQVDQAIKYLQDATATVPETPLTRHKLATIYLDMGRLYEKQKKYDLAEQNIRRSIEIWPRPLGWYYLGLDYFYQERYEESVAMHEKVIQNVPPNYAPIHLSIGAVYEEMKRIDDALREYNKYLNLAPDAPDRQMVEKRIKDLQAVTTTTKK